MDIFGLIPASSGVQATSVINSSMERINDYRLHSKNPGSPFNGFDAIFPSDVIMRGETVIEGRELIGDRMGKYVRELK